MKENEKRPTTIERPLTTQEILDSITDEVAQEMGYPNREVFLLSLELGNIAADWRETKDELYVQKYHDLFFELQEKGWNISLLDVQDVLPTELMPPLPPGYRYAF